MTQYILLRNWREFKKGEIFERVSHSSSHDWSYLYHLKNKESVKVCKLDEIFYEVGEHNFPLIFFEIPDHAKDLKLDDFYPTLTMTEIFDELGLSESDREVMIKELGLLRCSANKLFGRSSLGWLIHASEIMMEVRDVDYKKIVEVWERFRVKAIDLCEKLDKRRKVWPRSYCKVHREDIFLFGLGIKTKEEEKEISKILKPSRKAEFSVSECWKFYRRILSANIEDKVKQELSERILNFILNWASFA